MLPAASRLRRRPDFTATVRRGRRAGRARLVVHIDLPAQSELLAQTDVSEPARVGFVVSRTVGSAVVRNRVRRQLRHLMAARLAVLPAGSRVVVRVLPAAAGSTSSELAADLDSALARVTRRGTPRTADGASRTTSMSTS